MIPFILILIIVLFFFVVVSMLYDLPELLKKAVSSSKIKNKDIEELKTKINSLSVEVTELKERVYLLEKTNEIVDTIKKKKCSL